MVPIDVAKHPQNIVIFARLTHLERCEYELEERICSTQYRIDTKENYQDIE